MARSVLVLIALVLALALTATAQVSSSVATINVYQPYSTFRVEQFRTRMGTALQITPARVTVQQKYPYPLVDPGAVQTTVMFLILNDATATRFPLGSDAIGFLNLLVSMPSNTTLVQAGLNITAIAIGEDPSPPIQSDSSSSSLSTGAIVLIIFSALCLLALLGLAAALVLFVFKQIKKTIMSHRHRRSDADYPINEGNFDSDSDSLHRSESEASYSEGVADMLSEPSSSDVVSDLSDDSEPDSGL